MQNVFIGGNLHEMSNLFLGHICIRKNISEVILPRVLRVQSCFFFSFFLHLISLPVLPNGPIRKVCAIISRVHCKEKTNWF